jgi:hypothetical protein
MPRIKRVQMQHVPVRGVESESPESCHFLAGPNHKTQSLLSGEVRTDVPGFIAASTSHFPFRGLNHRTTIGRDNPSARKVIVPPTGRYASSQSDFTAFATAMNSRGS